MDTMKGKSTIGEMMDLPNRIFHTLYHNYYLIEEEKKKQEKKPKIVNNRTRLSLPNPEEMNDIEEQLEDIM